MTSTYTTGDPICSLCGQYTHGMNSHVCPNKSYTTFGWTCPNCNTYVSYDQFHNCPCPVPIHVPTAVPVGPMISLPGWECPVCGTGNNPHRSTCGNGLCPDMLYKDEEDEDAKE